LPPGRFDRNLAIWKSSSFSYRVDRQVCAMCAAVAILLAALFASPVHSYHHRGTVYDRVDQEAEFSGFKTMMRGSRIVTLNLLYRGVTVFVPENDAVDRYDGSFSEELVLYHLASGAHTLRLMTLNGSLESGHVDNPPLWVTVSNGYYVNNAKIIEGKSNYVGKCKRNRTMNQVLHVVDEVLDTLQEVPYTKPTAYDFLEHHHRWKIGDRKVSSFLNRIRFHDRQNLFTRSGGHTFFIPVDDKIDDHRLQSIDSYIIDAHVIPHFVLFTRPTEKDFIFETASNGDYIYIVVALTRKNGKDYVKSHTILGNTDHKKGEILAEIVRGNIPVANGVVHLISQPLGVFDRELKPFPYLPVYYKISADPTLNTTFKLGRGRVNNIVRRESKLKTFFAPRDSTWPNYMGHNHQELSRVLSKHVVVSDKAYSMSKLEMMSSRDGGTTLETLSGPVRLEVVRTNGTYYIVWDRNRMRVSRPDYECSDGVVHIIDGVFATPKPRVLLTPKYSFWKMLKDAVA
jgi:uncharacterized surface protein with fasciclin (FAS1) repeats